MGKGGDGEAEGSGGCGFLWLMVVGAIYMARGMHVTDSFTFHIISPTRCLPTKARDEWVSFSTRNSDRRPLA